MERLRAVADTHQRYDFEFLFTDNASTDATFERLASEARADNRVRVIRFTRNFGFQMSILTNYLNARGDAAIQIDADLQDPPELFGEFLAAWEQGYKVVYGIRRSRPENPVLSATRKLFYRASGETQQRRFAGRRRRFPSDRSGRDRRLAAKWRMRRPISEAQLHISATDKSASPTTAPSVSGERANSICCPDPSCGRRRLRPVHQAAGADHASRHHI